MLKKITHSSATNAHLMTRTTQLLRHDVSNCPIKAQIRAADDQSDSRILIYIVMISKIIIILTIKKSSDMIIIVIANG